MSMTRDDVGPGRIGSFTSSSSGRSSVTTVKPATSGPGPIRSTTSTASVSKPTAPKPLKAAANGNGKGKTRSVKQRVFIQDSPSLVSTSKSPPTGLRRPTAMPPRPAALGSSPPMDNRRMSDLAGYRRDLAVLDPSGGRNQAPRDLQAAASSSNLPNPAGPWLSMAGNTSANGGSSGPGGGFAHTFFDDSSDNLNLSFSPQSSSVFRPSNSRAASHFAAAHNNLDYHDSNDEQRRPSVASVATASSQGSKHSLSARGGFKKLQGFFGEDNPGSTRDGSETSLPTSIGTAGAGAGPGPGPGSGLIKEARSFSFSRAAHRERNHSTATDHTRDASPSTSSRPRTPLPSSDVVPFLYQEANDIAKYGEAPVRDMMTGPDRERYEFAPPHPPNTSCSSRSVHSIAHHHHRHNKSNEDTMSLRPVVSQNDSMLSLKERSISAATTSRLRAQSPTPNGNFGNGRLASVDGTSSPGGTNTAKRPGALRGLATGLFRRNNKHRDDAGNTSTLRLRELPGSSSSRSLSGAEPSRPEAFRGEVGKSAGLPDQLSVEAPGRPNRQAPFPNKFYFKKPRSHKTYDEDDTIGPTDRNERGNMFHLDTNLSDMEGILARPVPMSTVDPSTYLLAEPEKPPDNDTGYMTGGAWNAPDSWAVRRTAEEQENQAAEMEDPVTLPHPEEKKALHCIRVFRVDGTFATIQLPLDSTVTDVMSHVSKKTYVQDGLENYHIVLKKHDLVRALGPNERPLMIQKRLLQQIGYEEKDRLEDIGREDNSFLCRFLFLSARDANFTSAPHELGFNRIAKSTNVDLSGWNLITIPITLYSKTNDIHSLNLSRNLSLDVPRDFIQRCPNLREIKFTNNEARKLPISIGTASKLTVLDVCNNRLEELEHADLQGLTGLIKLNLANNRLRGLPSYFGAFRALRSLNMSSNFLEKLPAFVCEIESLVDIDFSFNSISALPDEIGRLKNVEKFVITNNRLAGSMPESFSQLALLRELDIKHNALTSIDEISRLPKLEVLTADHNQVSQFIGHFQALRRLKLNANPLTKFDITAPIPTLTWLNLSSAQLASIDGSFNNLSNLEHLELDRNYFVSLPNQVGNLKKLEYFSSNNNHLAELPPEIGCLTELKHLDIKCNSIKKLPMEIWFASKLETLNASCNIIDSFPKPGSRMPHAPGEAPASANNKTMTGLLSRSPSADDLFSETSRRPSQASSTLLSVGPPPVPPCGDRKGSTVSLWGQGGRKSSVVSSRTATGSPMAHSMSSRKDSNLSKLSHTFAGSLKHLYLAENQLDDEVFDRLNLLGELRILNLSYNDLSDMPQRSIKNWPHLVELYLSGNDFTSLPADDLEEYSWLQVLHINGNKFTNLPADISRAKKLAVLDCGNNSLKYNISNVPYDWNWNLNPNLRYLNLSGNKRLEIKQTGIASGANREQYTDFNRLQNLRVLGLMDVTLTQPSIPDQSEDRRVRTSGSLAGHLPYGMADTLGKNEHLSTIDLVVPRFNSSDTETLLGLFDGQALSSGGSKVAKYLHENFGHIFASELKALKTRQDETPMDALRRAFLALNRDLVSITYQHTEERPVGSHRASAAPLVLSKEDLNSGGVATVAYLQGQELYVANVGDAQAVLISTDGRTKHLTRKHDPADASERQRIRDAGGWVSRQGKLNDLLEVSRAFGYVDLTPAVQAAPHVTHVTITPQDEIIMIATKEVWDNLKMQLVVDLTRTEKGDLMRASQKLRDITMAQGATGKIMVMMISVLDLKRRQERSARLNRGQSMSLYPSGVPDDFQYYQAARRGKKAKGEVLDSTLHRLEAEVPAPTDKPSIVFTDIKNSTNLWEMYPSAMRSAIKLHNELMRRQLRRIGGYEVKTEGDAFMVSFPTATSALLWCFSIQIELLEVNWPSEVLNSPACELKVDKENLVIFRGLSVRMGIHYGEPVAEVDPVTRRMDYFGPMVNKASRISAVADGGQIAVSADFISEIQRCLETYQENDRSGSMGSDEGLDDDGLALTVRKELKSLSSQGFEVKEMGEKKLKGLENPEFVYSLYPHRLAGRIPFHNNDSGAAQSTDKPATLQAGSELGIVPEMIWSLWQVSLRLEMLCSMLEGDEDSPGLQPPETELLDRMKSRGGEVTERFLVNFMDHQVSRIETCVTTLALRHMAVGSGLISCLDDLRGPMPGVLDDVAAALRELDMYKAKYGPLNDESGSDSMMPV